MKLCFRLKRLTWTVILFSVLALPYLFAQSDSISDSNDTIAPAPETPTDALIDISNIKVDKDLIYGPSPWILPQKYENSINSEYRREFFRMTGIEYSGLHWKQFVMVYMNIDPEVYVNNYYDYIRLYYSDDEEEDWEDEADNSEDGGWVYKAENDDGDSWGVRADNDEDDGWDEDESWDETGNNEDENWDETENEEDDGWDEIGNGEGESSNEIEVVVGSQRDDTEFDLFVPGTVLLKEHYRNENGQPGAPESITLMIKREKGYDPTSGDWEYSQFDTNGNMMMEGNSQRNKIFHNCTKCHANVKERDYIFTTYSSWLPIPEKDD